MFKMPASSPHVFYCTRNGGNGPSGGCYNGGGQPPQNPGGNGGSGGFREPAGNGRQAQAPAIGGAGLGRNNCGA